MPYPKHLYESIRLKIAIELLQKELIPLLPSVFKTGNQTSLHKDINDWIIGQGVGLAPFYDFWNLFEGIIAGSKIKNGLVKAVTAENVQWQQQALSIKEIPITWKLPILGSLGEPPYKTSEIKQRMHADSLFARDLQQNLNKSTSKAKNSYLIVVTKRAPDQPYRLEDGNHRLIRALIDNQLKIKAWIGIVQDGPALKNYWVSMSVLNNLTQLAFSAHQKQDTKIINAVKKTLHGYFKESKVAKINYELRIAPKSDFNLSLLN